MTVKLALIVIGTAFYFSNWIIYVTVKHFFYVLLPAYNFSNWIIYVTVKRKKAVSMLLTILVTG